MRAADLHAQLEGILPMMLQICYLEVGIMPPPSEKLMDCRTSRVLMRVLRMVLGCS